MKDKRGIILDTLSDLISGFLYYDRKEDDDLGVGEIEKAIADGEITVDELVAEFRNALEDHQR